MASVTDVSAAVQAISALITATATVVLVRVTTRYAKTSAEMLQAVHRERLDRIQAARAPVANALAWLDGYLSEIEEAILSHKVTRVGDLKMRGNIAHGHVARAALDLTSPALRKASNALSDVVFELTQSLPREPAQDEPVPSEAERAEALQQLIAPVGRVRNAMADVQAQLATYVG
jgi:hypothetical protein